jgi:hypothetical protein
MLGNSLRRRDFLIFSAALLLAPARRLAAQPIGRRGTFAAEFGVLYGVLSYHVKGEIEESVDRGAGRCEVRLTGEGSGVTNRTDMHAEFREGRWAPVRSESKFEIQGREGWTRIKYDYERRRVEYQARTETFFLRKLRVVDDVVALPEGVIVDDAITAALNYRDGYWKPGPDGNLLTHIVRRRHRAGEGPDDVANAYRAEVLPLELKMVQDPETQKPAALVDLTRFSSWARENQPARVVFDDERRPVLITGSMILGSSVTIRLVA